MDIKKQIAELIDIKHPELGLLKAKPGYARFIDGIIADSISVPGKIRETIDAIRDDLPASEIEAFDNVLFTGLPRTMHAITGEKVEVLFYPDEAVPYIPLMHKSVFVPTQSFGDPGVEAVHEQLRTAVFELIEEA